MLICVMGLGALGGNLLLQLAKKYSDFEYIGVDCDEVEDRNIPIQPYFLEHIGLYKTMAMQAVFPRFVRKMKYTPIQKKIEKFTDIIDILDGIDKKDVLVLDCFDNKESRSLVAELSKDVACLHIGFSPELSGEVTWDEKYTVPGSVDPDAEDICEVRSAIPFIHFMVNFATMVIDDYFESQVKNNYIITNRFHIRRM